MACCPAMLARSKSPDLLWGTGSQTSCTALALGHALMHQRLLLVLVQLLELRLSLGASCSNRMACSLWHLRGGSVGLELRKGQGCYEPLSHMPAPPLSELTLILALRRPCCSALRKAGTQCQCDLQSCAPLARTASG